MQLASDVQIPDGLLAEMTLLSEKPRLGFGAGKCTVHQGLEAAKYLNRIGDTTTVVRYSWQMSLKAQQQTQQGPVNDSVNWANAANWAKNSLTVSGVGAGLSAEAGLGPGTSFAGSVSGGLDLVTHPDGSEATRIFSDTVGGTDATQGHQSPSTYDFAMGASACACGYMHFGSGTGTSLSGQSRIINMNVGFMGVTMTFNGPDGHYSGVQFGLSFGFGAGWSVSSYTTNSVTKQLSLP